MYSTIFIVLKIRVRKQLKKNVFIEFELWLAFTNLGVIEKVRFSYSIEVSVERIIIHREIIKSMHQKH